jgi:hypothetical protein
MSTPSTGSTAPPAEQPKVSAWVGGGIAGLAIIPLLFAFVFHLGAAYLSYQKYGSFLWALLDFVFAVFYYPYYAFVLSKAPAPQQGLMGTPTGGFRRRR